ncbi:MAG: radical SAM protein [Pseudomonadota bacterium]
MKNLRDILKKETWRVEAATAGSLCVAYPGGYREAVSSLGYHFALGCGGGLGARRAQRTFAPGAEAMMRSSRLCPPLRMIESERSVASSRAVFISVAYELQLGHVVDILERSGLEALRRRRKRQDPAVFIGGACTMSNPALLAPVADAVVAGDGEGIIGDIAAAIDDGRSREDIVEELKSRPSVIAGEHNLDSFEFGCAPAGAPPVCSLFVSPVSVFKNMFLVELMRGCPHGCAFCIMASGRSRAKPVYVPAEKVLACIPDWAARVGLVGASVLDHPEIDLILEELGRRSVELGLSSMRAARLSEKRAAMLAAAKMTTATVALDSPSERIRLRIKKPAKRKHVVAAAANAKKAGIRKLRLYALVGFEGEEEHDYTELADTCRELGSILPTTVSLGPVVPKRFTPLREAPFMDRRAYRSAVMFIRKRVKGSAAIKAESYRTALREYELSRLDYGGAHDLVVKRGF